MISVVIPTYNASAYLPALLDRLAVQTAKYELIVIDSSSTDRTPQLLRERDIDFHSIPQKDFNHGGTRNLGVSLASHENIVMLTQDALPANQESLEKLVAMLNSDSTLGMAYGRQLAHPQAELMSQYARLTNYPPRSSIKSKADIDRLGIRTCHCSNSFAVYRKSALLSVGGFPTDTVLGEDVVVAARLIQADRPLAYCAEAQVYHSHDYTVSEEFRRYFDIGAFHKQQQPLLRPFQRAESEGFRYVVDEWQYLRQHHALSLIPTQLLRSGVKYLGYRLGRLHDQLPTSLKLRFSMHPGFWVTEPTKESHH